MIAKTAIAASIAALLLATTATAALAANAIVVSDAYIYEDNDSDSDVLGVIEDGNYVDVIDCGARWCLLDLPGHNGYIRRNRLAFNIGPIYGDDDVDVDLGFGINSNGNFSFGFGISD